PDVGDLALVPRQRDAPGLARAADAEVVETPGDEGARLVVAIGRKHEVRPLVEDLEQPLLVCRQTEEVVLLLDPLRRDVVDRALAVDEVSLGVERLAADAVEAGVDVLVDVAVVVDSLQEAADELLVALVARPDEEVDRC